LAKIDHTLTEFKGALAQHYGERLTRLVCYGSVARGEAGPESDVDLALILIKGDVQPSREIDQVVDLLADFNLRHGVLISLMPVDQETWEKAEGPFWRNVGMEGREI